MEEELPDLVLAALKEASRNSEASIEDDIMLVQSLIEFRDATSMKRYFLMNYKGGEEHEGEVALPHDFDARQTGIEFLGWVRGLDGFAKSLPEGITESEELSYLDHYLRGRNLRRTSIERTCAGFIGSSEQDFEMIFHAYCLEYNFALENPNSSTLIHEPLNTKTTADSILSDSKFDGWRNGVLGLESKNEYLFLQEEYQNGYRKGVQYRRRILET